MNNDLTNHQAKVTRSISRYLKTLLPLVMVLILNITIHAENKPVYIESETGEIQLQLNNVTLKDAFKEIERQSKYTFLYNDASINVGQEVTVNLDVENISELLDQLLADKVIQYTIVDNQIVLTPEIIDQDGKKTISGKVTDADTEEPLPGVTVVEKGTSNGTITDLDGNFTLDVAEDATVVISYVGYLKEEIQVANRDEFDVSLALDVVSLDDVVVIGYGSMKKSDLTGAVASVSSEELQQSTSSGIDQALQGRTAGVNVTASSGSPGAAPSVRIRGMGTVTNPNPFFVVDGLPMSADAVGQLNPGDIESLEVLKDASAAAIYGARAANGVVLITTKKGKAGESQVSFDAYTGIQSLAKKYDIMDAQNYIEIRNAATNDDENPTAVPSTDWQDEVFRQASVSNYQLSFSGGSENINYALIGSYHDEQGILRGTDYERFTLRLNTSSDVKPWLNVGENIGFSHVNRSEVPEQDEHTSAIITALNMDPAMNVYTEDGNHASSSRNNIRNPVGIVERSHNITTTNRLFGNLFTDIKPFSWLTFRSSLGIDVQTDENEQFFPEFFESVENENSPNKLFRGNYDYSTFIWENTVTFNRTIREKHDLQVLAGYTRQKNTYRMSLTDASDVPQDENLWYLSNAADPQANNAGDLTGDFYNITPPNRTPYDATIASYLGRIIYSFDNMVDFTASMRRDGSSKFGPEQKWANFPSFAAGFRLSELAAIQDISFLNFLKIRAGWGKLGNQEIGNYAAFAPINSGLNYTFGTYPDQYTSPGGAPIALANKQVRWEETEQTNFGLDMNFFNNSLWMNIDYFIRNTNDMLVSSPIPYIVGVEVNPTVNIGSVTNKGLEFNAGYRGTVGDFSYSINGNIGAIQNEVTDLGAEDIAIDAAEFRVLGYLSRTEAGHPIASFYGYQTDGYWQNEAEIEAANEAAQEATGDENAYYDPAQGRLAAPGDIKFKDLNGDNQITSEDRTFIGSPHPDFTYGVNLELNYKFVDLKVFGQGVSGNDIFMATMYYLESPNGYWNMLTTVNDYWEEEGDNPTVPRLGDDEGNNLRPSDRYIKDGSYFRIKNAQLGFTIPNTVTQRIGVQKFRIYIAGQNLLSFHDYKGFDPEIGRGNDQGQTINESGTLDIGIDRGMYPIARTWTVGVNLTF